MGNRGLKLCVVLCLEHHVANDPAEIGLDFSQRLHSALSPRRNTKRPYRHHRKMPRLNSRAWNCLAISLFHNRRALHHCPVSLEYAKVATSEHMSEIAVIGPMQGTLISGRAVSSLWHGVQVKHRVAGHVHQALSTYRQAPSAVKCPIGPSIWSIVAQRERHHQSHPVIRQDMGDDLAGIGIQCQM